MFVDDPRYDVIESIYLVSLFRVVGEVDLRHKLSIARVLDKQCATCLKAVYDSVSVTLIFCI